MEVPEDSSQELQKLWAMDWTCFQEQGKPKRHDQIYTWKNHCVCRWSSDGQRPRLTQRDRGLEATSVIQREAFGGLPRRQRKQTDLREDREAEVRGDLMFVGRRGNRPLCPA